VKRMTDNSRSTWWVLYLDGRLETPIAILHDFELVQLADEIREQSPRAVKEATR